MPAILLLYIARRGSLYVHLCIHNHSSTVRGLICIYLLKNCILICIYNASELAGMRTYQDYDVLRCYYPVISEEEERKKKKGTKNMYGLSHLVVSSATRWVHLVRPLRPKCLTCITLGRIVLSILSSLVGVEKYLLWMASPPAASLSSDSDWKKAPLC
jgi:hypothetical protein